MILEEILNNLKKDNNKDVYSNGKLDFKYKTLYKSVKNLYNYLVKYVKDKTPIIVYGHKSIYMVICFLACSFAGIPYVPIDISISEERLKKIIENIKPKLILAVEPININDKFIINKNKIEKICNNYKTSKEIIPLMKEEDVYYIIFTSGSTGIPKGVQITYKNLNTFVKWFQEVIPCKNSVILNQAAFSFDLSVADLYLSLTTQSKIIVLEKDIQQDYLQLFNLLNKKEIQIAIITPSFAEILLVDKNFNSNLLPDLNTIYFCGENLLQKTKEKLFERFENIRIINSYGPTECTVAVTYIDIKNNSLEQNLPIADFANFKQNANIYIVDKNSKVLQDEEIGEILICGESVSKGYFNNSNENNKFINFNGEKGYLTGDLGYYKNKKLYYKARKDRQIKYKGYRIELDDVEKNILKIEYIEKCVVIPKILDNKIIKLIAYIKLQENCKKTLIEIRKKLLINLPEYMCPSIKILENFPINNNGKCDIKKLEEITNGRKNY